MDYQTFYDQLPTFYQNWGQETVHPWDDRFQPVLDQMEGMTTANVLQLLNWAVANREVGEIYCEVGSLRGSTLVAALLDHPDCVAEAINDFSQFDYPGPYQAQLRASLEKFGLTDQVNVHDQAFESFFLERRQSLPEAAPIGVYFYDAAHNYRSQLLGLLLVVPHLADRALIIVDDTNLSTAHQATWDFMASYPQCQMLLDLSTPQDAHGSFWNGLHVLSWDRSRTTPLDSETFTEQGHPLLHRAIDYPFPLSPEDPVATIDQLRDQAAAHHMAQNFAAADRLYQKALLKNGNRSDIWHNLGLLYYTTGHYQQAHKALAKAVRLAPHNAQYAYHHGLSLEAEGNLTAALAAYAQAQQIDPHNSQILQRWADTLFKVENYTQAESIYGQILERYPQQVDAYINLGATLLMQGQAEAAIELYHQALELKPKDPTVHYNLSTAYEAIGDAGLTALHYGFSLYYQQQFADAIEQLAPLRGTVYANGRCYCLLADSYRQVTKQLEPALSLYQEGVTYHPQSADLYLWWAWELQEWGQTEMAITVAQAGCQQLPQHLGLALAERLMLPILYQDEAAITAYRQRWIDGLQQLSSQLVLDTPAQKKDALAALATHTNFFLQYQGYNDRAPQQRYGNLAHRIMAASYPDWVQPRSLLSVSTDKRIRVGYVSSFMRNHTVGKLSLGWLKYRDRQQFRLHSYYVGKQTDAVTDQFRLHSDAFWHIHQDLAALAQQILQDQLHILVFLDIGMNPLMTQLGALRLAPVQCCTWGHPVTTGLPTIDYFLTSQLMEPDDAADHYTETLVSLPNIGFSYLKPTIPDASKTRADFGLPEQAMLYLCCQSLFKYLPQYDGVLADISRQVPQAHFVFLSFQTETGLTEQFSQRLQKAFAAMGVEGFPCTFLPRLSQVDYWNLNRVCDIYLDSLGWSGGNTTLEAVYCGLPVVTWPGALMRGRSTYGILQMMGLTDTIAVTPQAYSDIAVRLGQDPAWRSQIRQKTLDSHDRLYDDLACVQALETFYRQVRQTLS